MKKLCQIAALFLCLSLAFINTGCDKEQDDNPVNPITPTLTTNPVSDKTVPIGCNDSISWETQGISSLVVKINGEMVSTLLKGSIKFSSITEEKIVEFEIPDNKDMNKTVRLMPQSISYPKPTINLSKNPDRLPENGGQVTITWTTTNADSVLHNNHWYPPSGSISYNLTDTTTFIFTAKGKGGEVSDNIIVYVDVVIYPPLYPLTLGPWKEVKHLYTSEFEGIYNEEIDISAPCQQDDRYIFTQNGTFIGTFGPLLCEGGTISEVNWPYEFAFNTIFGLGDPRYVIKLTADTLIWQFNGISFLPDTTVVNTHTQFFIHP